MNSNSPKRKVVKLKLGSEYHINWYTQSQIHVKFIQTTEKGFNFLNLETSKCVLKTHLYPTKLEVFTKKGGMWFFINCNLNFK